MMEHSSFSKILLGLDGSAHAQAAIEYACQLAGSYNATITRDSCVLCEVKAPSLTDN